MKYGAFGYLDRANLPGISVPDHRQMLAKESGTFDYSLHGVPKHIVFKNNALDMHRNAKSAAIAAMAAARQGKFWAFHDRLFAENSGR